MISALPVFDFDRDLAPRLHAVEELRRRQHARHRCMHRRASIELEEDLGIHQVAHQFGASRFAADLLAQLLLVVRRDRPGADARPDGPASACRPCRMTSCTSFGQPPSGSPSDPENMSTTEFGSVRLWFGPEPLELLDGHAVADQEDRHVADHLARRRHFHDVAERHVHVGIRARDLRPARAEAHRLRPAPAGSCTGRRASRADRPPPCPTSEPESNGA